PAGPRRLGADLLPDPHQLAGLADRHAADPAAAGLAAARSATADVRADRADRLAPSRQSTRLAGRARTTLLIVNPSRAHMAGSVSIGQRACTLISGPSCCPASRRWQPA